MRTAAAQAEMRAARMRGFPSFRVEAVAASRESVPAKESTRRWEHRKNRMEAARAAVEYQSSADSAEASWAAGRHQHWELRAAVRIGQTTSTCAVESSRSAAWAAVWP